MKAPSARYLIRHRNAFRPLAAAAAAGVHPQTPWAVVERATGRVVWTGKTFRGARTAHAQRELGIPYAAARRMGNA